ncbi:PadR family transcriptional regulator [bacterium]|nr:PadR family transcriptional regulator [bacterium]
MDQKTLWGVLDMLILDVLASGPNYGYAISQSVVSASNGYFDLKEGSLYPALHRLERQRLLNSYWQETEEGRRRKYYKITSAGQAELNAKRKEWNEFSAAVGQVLGARHAFLPA